MKVLAVNCGSSTLKFQLIDTAPDHTAAGQERRLAGGLVERIGPQAISEFAVEGGEPHREAGGGADHAEATHRPLNWLGSTGLLKQGELEAVGYRVVHGGDRFREPTLIDDEVMATVEALGELAPLHNGPSLSAVRIALSDGPLCRAGTST